MSFPKFVSGLKQKVLQRDIASGQVLIGINNDGTASMFVDASDENDDDEIKRFEITGPTGSGGGASEEDNPLDDDNDWVAGNILDDVEDVSIALDDHTVILKWIDPSDKAVGGKITDRWKGTIVVRKEGAVPQRISDGTVVVNSIEQDQYADDGYFDENLVGGKRYYYRFFPYTTDYQYTSGTSVSVKINNVEISSVPTQRGTLTYNGLQLTADFDNYNHNELEVANNTATNAGLYTATFTPKPGFCWSDGTTISKDVSWRIYGISLNIPSTSDTFTYNNAVTIDPSVDINWSNYDSSKMSISGQSQKNAGTHSVVFSLTDSNYQWSDGTTGNKTVNWTITKATYSSTININGYAYNGAKSIPTVTNNPENGTVTYYAKSTAVASEIEWSNVTPTTFNAGNRFIYAVIAETSNYESCTTELTEYIVSKGTYTSNVVVSDYTYAGTKSIPSVSNNPENGTVTYYARTTSNGTLIAWDELTNTTLDAGTRYICAVIEATTNYESYTTANTSFTINKANITGITVDIDNYTYNGTKSTPSISNNPTGGVVTYYGRSSSGGASTAWDNITSTTYNAGTRYVYAVIAATTNYNSFTTPEKSFTISKANISNVTVNINGYTYGGTKSTPSISSNPSGGAVIYYGKPSSNGGATEWNDITSTTYDAGTRYVYAVIESTTNYNSFTTESTSFEIAKANMSGIIVQIDDYFYNGTKSTPSLANAPSDVVVSYYGKNSSDGEAIPWGNVTSTTYDAGTRYVYAVIEGSTNYNSFTTPDKNFTVKKGTLSNITVNITGYTYGGTKTTPSISSNPSGGTVTYYGRSSTNGSSTLWNEVTNKTYDAGTRYVYAVIGATTNYNSYTTSNTPFTIAKADLSGITVSISGYTYGGTKSTPTLSSNPDGGNVTYYGKPTINGTETNWNSVTSTTYDAGTRYLYAVIAESTNYNSFTTETVSFTIVKGTFTATVNISDYTYAGTKSTPTLSNNPGGGTVTYYGMSNSGGDSTNWNSVTNTTYNAGVRYIYATIAESTNYQAYTTAEKAFNIEKADGNISLSSSNITLKNSHLSEIITFTSVGDGNISISGYDSSLIDVVLSNNSLTISSKNNEKGNTSITVTISDTNNYNSDSKTIYVTLDFFKIVTWANGTDEEIYDMVMAARNDEINLYDYWNSGDERTVTIAKIPKVYKYEYNQQTSSYENTTIFKKQDSQNITFVLMKSTTGSNQVRISSSKFQNVNFFVGMKNCLNTKDTLIGSSFTSDDFDRFGDTSTDSNITSLDSSDDFNYIYGMHWIRLFYLAIPEMFRGIFLRFQFPMIDINGSSTYFDGYFSLFTIYNIYGEDAKNTYHFPTSNPIIFEYYYLDYYQTTSNRYKKILSSVDSYWIMNSNNRQYITKNIYKNYITTNATLSYSTDKTEEHGLSFIGCI